MANAEITAINANFKQQLGAIQKAVGDFAKLYGNVPFVERPRHSGDVYRQPVLLRNEQGWSAEAPGNGGSADLNGPITMVLGDSQLLGYGLVGQTRTTFEELSRSATSTQVFETEPGLRMMSLRESGQNRLEMLLFYGQVGLGHVNTNGDVATSATVRTLTFTDASWAGGFWAASEGAAVEFYTDADVLVSNASLSKFTVGVVDQANKTVAFTAESSGLATELSTALDTQGVDAYFYGFHGNEMAGVKKILTNTSTYANIDAGTYNLWRGSTYPVGGSLNLSEVNQGIKIPVLRTGTQKAFDLYVSPGGWADLMNNAVAQRVFDSSYKTNISENGSKELRFFSQNNNEIRVISHPFVKNGDAFALERGNLKRIGSQDLSFSIPGFPDDQLWTLTANKSSYQLLCYSNQSLFVQQPAKCLYLSDIVNTSN